jgi:hypothetical protein
MGWGNRIQSCLNKHCAGRERQRTLLIPHCCQLLVARDDYFTSSRRSICKVECIGSAQVCQRPDSSCTAKHSKVAWDEQQGLEIRIVGSSKQLIIALQGFHQALH